MFNFYAAYIINLMRKIYHLVLIDTNFLMMPLYKQVNPFEGIEEALELKPRYAVLSSSIEELKRIFLEEESLKERKAARFGLELIKKCNIEIIDDTKLPGATVDDKIIEFVKKNMKKKCFKLIVATNDRELKRKLRTLGIPVIMYRERDHRIWLDGEI